VHNSHQYITPILAALLTAEHRRLEAEVVRMHLANKNAWGKPGDGFVYKGEFYVPKGTPNGKRTILPLRDRLQSEMDDHITDRSIIENDGARIQQLLFKLLEPCGFTGHMDQDIRDAIPECIQDLLPEQIRQLERMRPPVSLLKHPRDFRFYEEVLPRIEFYSAARLLY